MAHMPKEIPGANMARSSRTLPPPQFRPGHKFRAKQTIVDGIKFPSKLEASRYGALVLAQKAGHVLFFLQQVPVRLPGGTKLVVDFQVFWPDGTVTFEDTKGKKTETYNVKKREVEALYPFTITEITR